MAKLEFDVVSSEVFDAAAPTGRGMDHPASLPPDRERHLGLARHFASAAKRQLRTRRGYKRSGELDCIVTYERWRVEGLLVSGKVLHRLSEPPRLSVALGMPASRCRALGIRWRSLARSMTPPTQKITAGECPLGKDGA